MKHFSLRILIGILTFFVGVSIVMLWYFNPPLQSSTDESLLPQTGIVSDENNFKTQFKDENFYKSQSNILFDGKNIDVIEDVQSNFEQIPFDTKSIPKSRRCFQKLEKTINNKLALLGLKGNTKYFKFDEHENESFTLRLNKEQSAEINIHFLKKLDSNADSTLFDELYFIKNNKHEYLLLTGHATATSGIGHLYWWHTLVPLDSNKSIVEFQSMFSDPRKIKIDDSGTIYYTQIDSSYCCVVKEVYSENFPVKVSLFSFDGDSSKKLAFNYDCRSQEVD